MVTGQNESMSARNAQLEIENESLKNELQNAKTDYAELQSDMNDVRDYYQQVDLAASNMEHRCEVRKKVTPLACSSNRLEVGSDVILVMVREGGVKTIW